MDNTPRSGRRFSSTRGSVMIELMISLALLLMVFTGIMELARAYRFRQSMSEVSKEAGKQIMYECLAVDPREVCMGFHAEAVRNVGLTVIPGFALIVSVYRWKGAAVVREGVCVSDTATPSTCGVATNGTVTSKYTAASVQASSTLLPLIQSEEFLVVSELFSTYSPIWSRGMSRVGFSPAGSMKFRSSDPGVRSSERGAYVIIVAATLMVLLLIFGAALELSFNYLQQLRLQRSLDAAAANGTRLYFTGTTESVAELAALNLLRANLRENGIDPSRLDPPIPAIPAGSIVDIDYLTGDSQVTRGLKSPRLIKPLSSVWNIPTEGIVTGASRAQIAPLLISMVFDNSTSMGVPSTSCTPCAAGPLTAEACYTDPLDGLCKVCAKAPSTAANFCGNFVGTNMSRLKLAAKAFIDAIEGDIHQMSIVSFQTRATLNQVTIPTTTAGRAALKSIIDGFQPFMNTNIQEGLEFGIREIESYRASSGRSMPSFIVLFSDGAPTNARVRFAPGAIDTLETSTVGSLSLGSNHDYILYAFPPPIYQKYWYYMSNGTLQGTETLDFDLPSYTVSFSQTGAPNFPTADIVLGELAYGSLLEKADGSGMPVCGAAVPDSTYMGLSLFHGGKVLRGAVGFKKFTAVLKPNPPASFNLVDLPDNCLIDFSYLDGDGNTYSDAPNQEINDFANGFEANANLAISESDRARRRGIAVYAVALGPLAPASATDPYQGLSNMYITDFSQFENIKEYMTWRISNDRSGQGTPPFHGGLPDYPLLPRNLLGDVVYTNDPTQLNNVFEEMARKMHRLKLVQ